jgi:hypothetical protein
MARNGKRKRKKTTKKRKDTYMELPRRRKKRPVSSLGFAEAVYGAKVPKPKRSQ